MQTVQAGEVLSTLMRSPIFQPCDQNALSLLVERASVHVADRSTVIAGGGKPFPYLGLVSQGIVSVTIDADAPMRSVRRVELYHARPGDVFGEAAFYESAPPLGDIVAISKRATYVLLPSAAVERALELDHNLCCRMAADLAKRVRHVAQRLTVRKGFPALARVASVLLSFASDDQGLQPAHPELAAITQRDIAAAAACVKESATRAISALEAAGALRRERGHITQLDRTVLSDYAEMKQNGTTL